MTVRNCIRSNRTNIIIGTLVDLCWQIRDTSFFSNLFSHEAKGIDLFDFIYKKKKAAAIRTRNKERGHDLNGTVGSKESIENNPSEWCKR